MPNTMPGNSMRGHLIKRIEGLFADPNEDHSDPNQQVKGLISDLASQNEHFDTILTKGYAAGRVLDPGNTIDAAHLRHMKIDWFGRKGGNPDQWRGRWWRGTSRQSGHQPIDPIVRGGFWTAAVLRNGYAQQNPPLPRPPISVVWLCAGNHFEIHVHPRKELIQVLLLTPHEGATVERSGLHEAGPFKDTEIDDEIYVIRRPVGNPRRFGYQVIPTIEGFTPPKYPDTGGDTTQYYHPFVPADPI